MPLDTTRPVDLTDGAVAIGGRPVLRGIDLVVESGEFVALLGANGSGKSTLVRALTGLRPLTRGELRLFGTPFATFDQWQRIGFVPQRSGAASGVPSCSAKKAAAAVLAATSRARCPTLARSGAPVARPLSSSYLSSTFARAASSSTASANDKWSIC